MFWKSIVERQILLVYGPTESTICSSMILLSQDSNCAEGSIGLPLEGSVMNLEDDELIFLDPMWHWAIGIVLNSMGKWGKRNGVRFFRTGDAVRQLGDGTFQFLGRIDRRTETSRKLIAPEKSEAALCLSPTVRRAHVVKLGEVLFAFIESVETSSFDSIQSSLHTQGYQIG